MKIVYKMIYSSVFAQCCTNLKIVSKVTVNVKVKIMVKVKVKDDGG